MPNNPLPTPTPPTPVTAKGGPVPQGTVPKVAPSPAQPAQGQPVAVKPGTPPIGQVPAAPNQPPKPAAPAPTPAPVKSPTVAPGQIKPPAVAPLKPPQPPTLPGAPTPQVQPAAKPSVPTAATPTPMPPKPAVPGPTSAVSIQPAPGQPMAGGAASSAPAPKPMGAAPTAPNQSPKPLVPGQPAPGQPVPVKPGTPPAGAPVVAAVKPAVPGAPVPAKPTLAPSSVPPTLPVTAAPGQAPVKPVLAAPGLPKPGQPAAVAAAAPAPAGAAAQTPPAQPAKAVKKPPFVLFAIIGMVILSAIGFAAWSFFAKSSNQSASVANQPTGNNSSNQSGKTDSTKTTPKSSGKQTTITYWGLWEPTEVLSQVIKDFETENPDYKIDYRKQSHRDYRERLQTAIASGNGPDIFRFHASWTPMLKDELTPMPSSVMSVADYNDAFYPVAAKQLSIQGQIAGIPLMYDGLALFYNKDILKTADAEPPQTWAELRTLADSLTVPSDKNARGNQPMQRAGMAIGNVSNVEHFSDILGLLILQNGGDLSKPNSPEVRDALLFYTNFLKEDIVWSSALPSSTVAFARGDVAMMLAPSWRVHDVKNLNPNLNFGIAPSPKLGDTRLGWASYWAEGVNAKSKNQEGAWLFLKYLSSADVLKKLYADASTVRSFGEIYPRQDMAKELNSDEITSQFLVDAPSADSWYLSSFTHDNGINDQLIKYYADAVNGILEGKSVDEVLVTVESGTTQVLRQYNAQ